MKNVPRRPTPLAAVVARNSTDRQEPAPDDIAAGIACFTDGASQLALPIRRRPTPPALPGWQAFRA